MSYDSQMDAEVNNSTTTTSSSLGDNPMLNAVTTFLSKQHSAKQHSASKGDDLPLNAQLLVLTSAHSKNTVEENALESGQGGSYRKTDNSDAFIPSFEQVHALATANLLASTQRDIAQQLAEASFSTPETHINKRQQNRPSPVKKRDIKQGGKLIDKKKNIASDCNLITPEPKALTCSFDGCSRKFASATHLKYHEMTHTNNRQHECPDSNCGKTFYTAQRLKVHLRTHTGEKPFKCSHEDCGKTFTTAGNLKNHERIHTGEQPFACDFDGCNRRFTEYSSLHKHKLTHSGDKPFKCKICNKKFTQSGSRRQHLIRHHLDEEIRNSLKASQYKKTNIVQDAGERTKSKTSVDIQHSVNDRSKLGEPSVSYSSQLMVLSSTFQSHPSSDSVVNDGLVSLTSGSNHHHLALASSHQHHPLEPGKVSSSHNLLNGVYEETIDDKASDLVALSQGSVYTGEDQERSVLYVTSMLNHEEVTHADYHISQEDISEEIVTSLEYHHPHHHNTNTIQTDVSLHHSSESHHSDLYQNHQDYTQHEDLHHSDTASSYLGTDGEVLHEEFIGTKEITIPSSSGLAGVSEEDPSYIPMKESVPTLIDWDEHLHKH